MTINTISNASGPYVGNGLSDTFDYDFKIFEESQLVIYETDDLGNVTTLQLGTDYSVTILNDVGGTVTRLAGPLPAGYTWYIKSNYQPTQDISFTSQGAFFPQIHEDAFDKLTMIIQQLLDSRARSLRVPDSESNAGDLVIPDAQTRAGRVLAFDEQGKPVEFSTMNQMNDVIGGMSAIETVSDNITAVLDAYQNAIDAATSEANAATSAANAATSAANAAASEANAATSEANAAATLNEFKSIYHGALPTAPTDATVSDGDLYFDTTLDEMRVYNGSVWKSAGSTVNGTVKRQTFTASGGEVTFTITGGYDAGYADVYLNGVKLVNGVDVDISSGTDIVLTESASAGDTIDFIGYGSFDVADTYSRAVADSRFAKIDGDSNQAFKVADAVNDDEALSKGQLLSEIQAVDGAGSGLDADTVDGIQSNLLGIGGAGYAWVDETSNRTAGTTYTNTTGKPIGVSIINYSTDTYSYILVDGIAVASFRAKGSSYDVSGFAIVPNGSTYSISNTAGFNKWLELK